MRPERIEQIRAMLFWANPLGCGPFCKHCQRVQAIRELLEEVDRLRPRQCYGDRDACACEHHDREGVS